ncbi:hypothetical protein PoB_005397400 [Plakobranchus ocellatus]|uniref:Uncharacterized protein n=1 Tax=Plakobranchus ocellatus TaxID=259542 RepID=A0AAV4C4J4_9GAST|nr:hypothetical protein PoB_005397400 [Plakobranchus ocellatus]
MWTFSKTKGTRQYEKRKENEECGCAIHKLDLLRSGESKGGEESNGKLPQNAVCQEQSGPYSWFPDA